MKATGWPWRFPDGELMGVFISAWASTQMRHRSGDCSAWPATEPIARLWEKKDSLLNIWCLYESSSESMHTGAVHLPVITSQHDQGMPGSNSSAHCTRQRLICCAHTAWELYIHVGFVLLNLVEVDVAKVMDRVVWGRQQQAAAINLRTKCI